MGLQTVTSINVFGISTMNEEIDTLIAHRLLHLELHLEESDTPFIMGSVPGHIVRTFIEHSLERPYKHRYLSMLNNRRLPGNVFHRVNSVNISLRYDNKKCHAAPHNVVWCRCDQFTGIDMSTYITTDKKEHQIDAHTGLILSAMYNAPLKFNNKKVKNIVPKNIYNELGLSVTTNTDYYFLHLPEPILEFFSHFYYSEKQCSTPDQRLSIEAIIVILNKLERSVQQNFHLTTVDILSLQGNGTYVADVTFICSSGEKIFRMIPSHAILFSTLLGQGTIRVEDSLLQKKAL